MSVEALATVWGPNLLERPNAAPSVEDSNMCTSIVSCLLGPFTNHFVLGESSSEFRQKFSAFIDEIWGQMIGEGVTKPPPEGISILEFPERESYQISMLFPFIIENSCMPSFYSYLLAKTEESTPSESPLVESPK